jgi:UDP-N-acetylmuramate-alanine ligase
LYDAGESPIEGVSRDALVAAIGPAALTLDPTKQSFSGILDRARQGTSAKHRTAVVFLGAGKSHDFAQQFVRQVKDNDAQNEAKDCSR